MRRVMGIVRLMIAGLFASCLYNMRPGAGWGREGRHAVLFAISFGSFRWQRC